MGYARTLAIALFNGGARRICAIAIIDLLTLPQWGLGNFSLPLVSRLGVEPRNLAVPDFKSVLQFAVRGFTKTQLYKSVRCVYQFRQRLIFRNLKVCWPSPYTLFNLHLYSTNGETRSELRGATPNFWPQSFDQISRRNDYLQLSPAIQKIFTNHTNY